MGMYVVMMLFWPSLAWATIGCFTRKSMGKWTCVWLDMANKTCVTEWRAIAYLPTLHPPGIGQVPCRWVELLTANKRLCLVTDIDRFQGHTEWCITSRATSEALEEEESQSHRDSWLWNINRWRATWSHSHRINILSAWMRECRQFEVCALSNVSKEQGRVYYLQATRPIRDWIMHAWTLIAFGTFEIHARGLGRVLW